MSTIARHTCGRRTFLPRGPSMASSVPRNTKSFIKAFQFKPLFISFPLLQRNVAASVVVFFQHDNAVIDKVVAVLPFRKMNDAGGLFGGAQIDLSKRNPEFPSIDFGAKTNVRPRTFGRTSQIEAYPNCGSKCSQEVTSSETMAKPCDSALFVCHLTIP